MLCSYFYTVVFHFICSLVVSFQNCFFSVVNPFIFLFVLFFNAQSIFCYNEVPLASFKILPTLSISFLSSFILLSLISNRLSLKSLIPCPIPSFIHHSSFFPLIFRSISLYFPSPINYLFLVRFLSFCFILFHLFSIPELNP